MMAALRFDPAFVEEAVWLTLRQPLSAEHIHAVRCSVGEPSSAGRACPAPAGAALAGESFAAPLAAPHRGATSLAGFSRSSLAALGTPWPLENPHVRLIDSPAAAHHPRLGYDGALATNFRREWNAVYERCDAGEEREAAFQELSRRYFERVGLAALFAQRLQELPQLSARLQTIMIRRVWSRKEERAELYARPEGATFLLGLQADRCLQPETLVAFLRHELLRASDMLDPAFAYTPHPELGGSCELEDDLIRERFRVLWDLGIAARMRRRGWPASADESARVREYERAFASWTAAEREAIRQRVEDGGAITQRALLDLARDARLMQPLGAGGVICPLCHFPTRDGIRQWSGEWASVPDLIQADYPSWEPSQGACLQCADLYRARVPAAVGGG